MTTPDVPVRAVVADSSAVIRTQVVRVLEDAGVTVVAGRRGPPA